MAGTERGSSTSAGAAGSGAIEKDGCVPMFGRAAARTVAVRPNIGQDFSIEFPSLTGSI